MINAQKQPGHKKKCGPVQNGQCEKVVKSMEWPRNSCDGKG